ncbi:hypothetical protein CKO35_15440 [Ectothiorhodospira shaposhnikovii]|uniref:hypothetical protein n=1 Tax=Ectothiorhodospira shaposhnikovii TaxID=1054 RepID=UPI001902C4FC|nr:hypothetical protein [Ectothiorhodospira shaposhnikovii]MBK1674658.1 hypothetical protein [Ectothiorhodospira shaposhnikovii]
MNKETDPGGEASSLVYRLACPVAAMVMMAAALAALLHLLRVLLSALFLAASQRDFSFGTPDMDAQLLAGILIPVLWQHGVPVTLVTLMMLAATGTVLHGQGCRWAQMAGISGVLLAAYLTLQGVSAWVPGLIFLGSLAALGISPWLQGPSLKGALPLPVNTTREPEPTLEMLLRQESQNPPVHRERSDVADSSGEVEVAAGGKKRRPDRAREREWSEPAIQLQRVLPPGQGYGRGGNK